MLSSLSAHTNDDDDLVKISTNALSFVFMAWFFPSKSFYHLFCARRLYGHLKTRNEFIYSGRIALGSPMHCSCAQWDCIVLTYRSMQMENAHQRKTLCRGTVCVFVSQHIVHRWNFECQTITVILRSKRLVCEKNDGKSDATDANKQNIILPESRFMFELFVRFCLFIA